MAQVYGFMGKSLTFYITPSPLANAVVKVTGSEEVESRRGVQGHVELTGVSVVTAQPLRPYLWAPTAQTYKPQC